MLKQREMMRRLIQTHRALMVTDGDKTAEGGRKTKTVTIRKPLFLKDRICAKIDFSMALPTFGALPKARLYWRTCVGSVHPTANGDNVANGVPGENGDGRPKPQDIGVRRGHREQRRGKEGTIKRGASKSNRARNCVWYLSLWRRLSLTVHLGRDVLLQAELLVHQAELGFTALKAH